ncbi:MAG: hypothetical protein NZL93_01775 [Chthoniobacterales bacterium]|nr:hypothetical protein [Chthoniobacterales bacterium]
MKRPMPGDWKKLLAAFHDTQDPEAVSGLTGLPLKLVKHAWEKGWPAAPGSGIEPLPPIKQLVSASQVLGHQLKPVLAQAISEDQKRYIQEAIAQGAARRALEGLVTDQFLEVCEKAMSAGQKLMGAGAKVAEQLAESMERAVQAGPIDPSEARSMLKTVTFYTTKMAEVMEAYSKVSEKLSPAALSQKPAHEVATPDQEELVARLLATLRSMDALRKGRVIEVAKEPMPVIPTTLAKEHSPHGDGQEPNS